MGTDIPDDRPVLPELRGVTASSLGFAWRRRKSGDVELGRNGRVVSIVRGGAASSFLARASACTPDEAQQLLARLTGHDKQGNERSARHHPRAGGRSET